MTILPLNPAANASPEALVAFLAECRDAAVRDGHAKLIHDNRLASFAQSAHVDERKAVPIPESYKEADRAFEGEALDT